MVWVLFPLGIFDADFIFEGAIHSCCREFTFNPCNVDLGAVEFVFDPHFVEFNFGTSMADHLHKAATTGSIHLSAISEYNPNYHYVPGLIGEGLFRIFLASIRKAPG